MAQLITGANGEDQRLTMTIRLWLENKLQDHFYGNNPLFRKLKDKNRVATGGLGTQITVPIKYPAAGGPVAAGVSDPYAARNHSAMTGITSALYTAAEYLMPISVPNRELKLQGSMTKKLSYVDSVMEIAMDRFNDQLRQHLMAAETDPNSNGSEIQLASLRTLFNKGGSSTTGIYQPLPLAAQLSASDATWGNAAVVSGTPIYTVGGINRNAAGNAYFCVPVKNPSVAETLSRLTINNLISLSTRNSDRADLLVVSRNHYDTLAQLLQTQQLIQPSKLQDYGFTAFSWNGLDVIWDDDVPSNTPGTNMFAINTDALKLVVDTVEPEMEQTTDPERPIKAWKASWFGQLVMTKMGRGAGSRHANLNP